MTDLDFGRDGADTEAAWFQYVDTVADVRPRLHAYCLRMTGTIWTPRTCCRTTLLRGFGAIGRGDLHGATAASSG